VNSWFNMRVVLVVISLFVLARLTQHTDVARAVHWDIAGCALLLAAFVVAYLLPLWQTFGFRRVLAPLVSILAAWTAGALALIADATNVVIPNAPEDHHYNWTMLAFCVAAGVAFYLFFDSTGRAFRLRNEILAIRGERRPEHADGR
jgi:hypothetical protein